MVISLTSPARVFSAEYKSSNGGGRYGFAFLQAFVIDRVATCGGLDGNQRAIPLCTERILPRPPGDRLEVNMRKKTTKSWALAVLLMGCTTFGWGQQARAEDDAAVVQKLAHGEVNWSTRMITATGSGAANLKSASVAVARLNAERAAKLDALRNVIETLQGVQVTGKRSVGDLMSNGEIRSKVQGMAQGFKVVDTRYYSDGSVDIVVQMPLSEELNSTLMSAVPAAKNKVAVATTGAETASGLVVNAKGLGLLPSMAPRLVDESGKEVYGTAVVNANVVAEGGLAGYAKDIDQAKSDARTGDKPVVIKALRLAKKSKTDLVLSNADADKLRAPDANLKFLTEGRVIIVVD